VQTHFILRITGFLDFIHCPEFWILRKHGVSETGSVSVLKWGVGGHLLCWGQLGPQSLNQVQWLRLALSKGPNRVGAVVPFTWGRKRNLFPKRRVFWYLEFQTMDEVREPSGSECCTPSTVSFRLHILFFLHWSLCEKRHWPLIWKLRLTTQECCAIRLTDSYVTWQCALEFDRYSGMAWCICGLINFHERRIWEYLQQWK
jgi:hypothetical protein